MKTVTQSVEEATVSFQLRRRRLQPQPLTSGTRSTPKSRTERPPRLPQCATTEEPIVVNSTGDDPLKAGAAKCETEIGDCTLRAAIELSNRNEREDTIRFDLPHASVISSPAGLPIVAHPVQIDASSVTAGKCSPTVALAGTDKKEIGIHFQGKESTLKGLTVYGFATAVELAGDGNHTVQCSYLGTDSKGEVAGIGNSYGIKVVSDFNQIGGDSRRPKPDFGQFWCWDLC